MSTFAQYLGSNTIIHPPHEACEDSTGEPSAAHQKSAGVYFVQHMYLVLNPLTLWGVSIWKFNHNKSL